MKRIAALWLMVLIGAFCGCQQKAGVSATPDEAPPSTAFGRHTETPTAAAESTVPVTEDTAERKKEEQASEKLGNIFLSTLRQQKVTLPVEELLQYPELPTGCESVALTAVLRYHGFLLGKTEIAEDYMLYSDDDLMKGYVGDPFGEENGAAIYPPALTETAAVYLTEKASALTAVNTMGASAQELYRLVEAGCPVAVWYTEGGCDPMMTDDWYPYNGKDYYWYENEHCVVLCGYDLQQSTVTLMDPLQGLIEEDAENFAAVYDETGRMSMTIL